MRVDTWTAELGGPVVRDRLHYFFGFENTYRGPRRASSRSGRSLRRPSGCRRSRASSRASRRGSQPEPLAERTLRYRPGRHDQRHRNFGGPIGGPNDAGFAFTQGILQAVNNFTWIRGNHSDKFGVDAQWVGDERTSALFQLYTVPTIEAYLAARAGTTPAATRRSLSSSAIRASA